MVQFNYKNKYFFVFLYAVKSTSSNLDFVVIDDEELN